ncbi:hypothetical protein RQM47_15250 [Rubrivirga sp. S365]|uniref:Rhomboid family intramembrane serine protease n=1 Tax=Rubrivirga litoralis TaxID=3075598 RepID=A0ABU3BT85_9BACT|nr:MULTISPECIES: rhomboid family intramembrane serine protease [unclassified Rubrivirga]MDT0632502.1 hypothetical protein [Rubrivirga sp. F394]MDT7858002.1 hypothetical protein [Rubrivirga sp. S365]
MADPSSPLFRFQLWRAGLPPALRLLLTVNIATYVLFVVLSIFGAGGLLAVLALPATPEGLLRTPWTPLTFAFANLYPGFLGLISFVFGFLWLSWMGRDYEESYGPHRLFGTYVLGALGGAAVAVAVGAASGGGAVVSPFGVYYGLWIPVTAVLCAYATFHPDRGIGLFLLGVVPMKWVAVGFVVLSLAFSPERMAILGAALTGVLIARMAGRDVDLTAWARPLFDRRRRPKAAKAPKRSPFARPTPVPSGGRRSSSGGRAPAPSVDQILDKILDEGYDSLTDEERTILDRASRG